MFCINCGVKLEDGQKFCPQCGKKQVLTYTQVFQRGNLSEEELINNINLWFQSNPKAANISCKFEMDTSIGFLANKYQLNKVVLEYELFKGENQNQYALVKEETMGLTKTKVKDYMTEWKASHPNVKVVDWEGGTHARGSTVSHLMGGFGARNRMEVYILFKFPRPEKKD